MKRSIIVCLAIGLVLAMASFAMATNQPAGTGIVGTSHDLSDASGVGGSWGAGTTADGSMDRICVYCHTPHHSATSDDNVAYRPLWNHEMSTAAAAASWGTYTNGSDTPDGIAHSLNADLAGGPGAVSKLCLSCHDGSVAISSYGVYGNNSEQPASANTNAFGRILIGGGTYGLSNHHPIGFNYAEVMIGDDEINDPDTLFINNPNDISIGSVLWGGKMECTSCHDVHNTKNSGSKFTWTEDQNSALCLTCHDK